MLFDTHCHVNDGAYAEDRPAVFDRAAAAGVGLMICPATDMETSAQCIAMAREHDGLYAAVGIHPEEAAKAIQLVMLVNDVSLRHLIPAELAKGFGFFQSKPASAFSPVAVTPDELGDAWQDSKLHLPLVVHLNGELFGKPNAGVDMSFNFGQLIAHVAKTRTLCAGSIIGSGTVSNKQGNLWGSSIANGGVGYCCLAEVRTYETIEQGKPITPFMRHGDVVRIEMFDAQGASIFGTIENTVDTHSLDK